MNQNNRVLDISKELFYKQNYNTLNITPWNNIVSLEENWMYCSIFRNASTSILNSFLNQSNNIANDKYEEFDQIGPNNQFCWSYKIDQDILQEFLANNPYSFVYLRDPIKKFMSCFLFKIINHPEKNKKNSPSYVFLNNYTVDKDIYNTFNTFVDYIVGIPEEYHEEHWRSQHYMMNFDKINYSEIIDFEDIDYHWNKLSSKYKYINSINTFHNRTSLDNFIDNMSTVDAIKNYKKIQDYYKKDYDIAKQIKKNISWLDFKCINV